MTITAPPTDAGARAPGDPLRTPARREKGAGHEQ